MEESNSQKINSRNSQHPIPQNFMDVEFKIIGELTMRQFVYLVAFGGPTYLLYIAPMNPIVKWPLLVFFGLLTFVLIAVPIDDRGADEWIVNLIKAIYGVNQRRYKKSPAIPKALSMKSVEFIQAGMIATTSTSNRRRVEEYIKGISKKEEKPDEFDFNFSSRRFVEVRPTISEALIEREFIKTQTPTQIEESKEKAFEEVVLFKPTTKTEVEEQISKPKFDFKKQIVVPEISKILPQKLKLMSKKTISQDSQDAFRTSVATTPGRKFISFSKKEAEELILPIRGEKSVNIFNRTPLIESNSPRKDIKTLAKELEQITKEAKKSYGLESFRTIKLNETENNSISGQITDEEGRPLNEINIEIYDDSNNKITTKTSNTEGKFIFENMIKGIYQLRVVKPYQSNLNFDIINLDLQGFPYPQIKIIGKK